MKRLMFVVASAVVWGAGAVPVTGDQAKLAVGNWLADEAAPMAVRFSRPSAETETIRDGNGKALFHVVKMEGGGYVATPTDTRINPIVVFSGSGELDLGEGSPLRRVLEADMAQRLEAVSQRGTAKGASGVSKAEKAWAGLLAHRSGRTRSIADESQLSEVRVSPLVKTKWDQCCWDDYKKGSPATYNRFTPYNMVCGCVATATAQIMKYHEWPKTAVDPSVQFVIYVNGAGIGSYMSEGAFDWANMPLSNAVHPDISQKEWEAIGKLTSDVGVSVNMSYTDTSGGSGTCSDTHALRTYFGYASAKTYYPGRFGQTIHVGDNLGGQMESAILASVDAQMPVMVGIRFYRSENDRGGHFVVIDGYGYKDDVRYMHINMGWSGSEDVWYDVMGETLSHYAFSMLEQVQYNIHPTKVGDVVSGRVLDSAGKAVANATVEVKSGDKLVESVRSNDKGIYYFRVNENGTYAIQAQFGESKSKVSLQEMTIGTSADFVHSEVADDTGRTTAMLLTDIRTAGTVGNKWGVDLTLEKEEDVVVVKEVVADPVIMPETAEFTNTAIQVTLSCSTEDATIRYTTNGADPTAKSAVYTGPISISKTTTVKAKAFKEGFNPSAVVTRSYKRITYHEDTSWKTALNNSVLTFYSLNEAAYDAKYLKAQNLITHDGSSALRMEVGRDETSPMPWMTHSDTAIHTTVSGSGLLTFWWRIGEEDVARVTPTSGTIVLPDIGGISTSFDRFELYVDDENVSSAPSGWWDKEYIVLGPGTHTITWKISTSFGQPCGFLDEVQFQMGAPESFLVPVTFDLNGGAPGSHPLPIVEKCYPNGYVETSSFVGTREGYKFIEWNTKRDGTGVSYSTSQKFYIQGEEPATLYAIWKKLLPVYVEFPYEGGLSKLPLSAYGHSITMFGGVPEWINKSSGSSAFLTSGGSFIVRGMRLNVNVSGGARVMLGNFLPSDAYAEFNCEKNDSYEPRTCDIYMDAIDYPFVIDFKITQRGDNQTHKLAGVALATENDAVASSSTKLVCKSVYRDSAVSSPNAGSVRWAVVSGGEYASVSSDGTLSVSQLSSAHTVRVRAAYSEGGISREATKDIRVVPSADLAAALSVNVANLVFSRSGANDWVGQTDVSLDGNGAARASSCANGERWMETKINVARSDSLEFDCLLSVGSGARLSIVDNGAETVCAGSSVNGANWIHVKHNLTPGEHVLRFVYSSEHGVVSVGNLDNAWIDRLMFGSYVSAVSDSQTNQKPQGPADPIAVDVPVVEPAGAFTAPKATTKDGVLVKDGAAFGVLQVKVGKESKAGESKVSVTVIGLDGKKYTAKAVKVDVGGNPTVDFEVKKLGTLTLTFGANGFSGTLNGMAVTSVDATAATTEGKATFAAGDLSSLAGVLTEYLPTDEIVTRTAKKWKVAAKAGKLKYVKPNEKKGVAGGLEAKGDNIAGLKLAYAPKTQTFKGSFKVWTFDEAKRKLKSVSAKVTGVVIDGNGYGQAVVKRQKIGNFSVK